MTTSPAAHETTSTTVDRVAHAFCPLCNPDPRPGDVVTALCGARHAFWGRRDRPVSTCQDCYVLASAVVYRCGHHAQSM